jgi:hypothetical protein
VVKAQTTLVADPDLNLRLPNLGRFMRTIEGDNRRLEGVGKGGSAPPLPPNMEKIHIVSMIF